MSKAGMCFDWFYVSCVPHKIKKKGYNNYQNNSLKTLFNAQDFNVQVQK